MSGLVVTGAGGYLGGLVVGAALAQADCSVRSVVRHPSPWLGGEVLQVRNLEESAGAAVEGADAVIHLAGPNEVATRADPDGALARTVSAARAVATACERAGVPKLIYVSTVHVYGAALRPGAVVDETTLPQPRDPYAIARLASEHTILASAGRTRVTIFRLTNGIGPPADVRVDRWSLVANDLCRQAARGGPVKLLTPGFQWRDFVFLGDAAEIMLSAATSGGPDPGLYNLGSGRSMTIRQLAGVIAAQADLAGLGPIEVEAPAPTGVAETDPFIVSVDRLARAGFAATTAVSDAVSRTIAFCRSNGL